MISKKKALIWSAISIVLMGIIFWFSSQNGSDSQVQSNIITDLLVRILPSLPYSQASHIVRKSAHFTIYLVLGFCVLQALYNWGLPSGWLIGGAVLICALYAGSDELHQLLSDGRSGQLTDVLLDSCGALCGSCISRLFLPHI